MNDPAELFEGLIRTGSLLSATAAVDYIETDMYT